MINTKAPPVGRRFEIADRGRPPLSEVLVIQPTLLLAERGRQGCLRSQAALPGCLPVFEMGC